MAKATKAKIKKKTVSKSAGEKETNLVRRVTLKPKNSKIEEFKSGDTVNVYVKVIEGEKERVQLYKGLVTKIQGSGSAKSFTVRKISSGIGVERTFPFSSPAIDSVQLVSHGRVRRSKLYFIRSLEGKSARIESELAVAVKGNEA